MVEHLWFCIVSITQIVQLPAFRQIRLISQPYQKEFRITLSELLPIYKGDF